MILAGYMGPSWLYAIGAVLTVWFGGGALAFHGYNRLRMWYKSRRT